MFLWMLLLPMLQDTIEYVREAAIKILGVQRESVFPLDALLPMLQDKTEYVREAAIEA